MERDLKIFRSVLKRISTGKGKVHATEEQLKYHLLLLTEYGFITGELTASGRAALAVAHVDDKNRIMDTMMDYEPVGYRIRQFCKRLLA